MHIISVNISANALLIHNLKQLDFALEQLRNKLIAQPKSPQKSSEALRKKLYEAEEQKTPYLHDEMLYEILSAALTSQEINNKETFLKALKTIRDFKGVSKQHKKILENPYHKKQIIRVLFDKMPTDEIMHVTSKMPKLSEISGDPTVLGDINTILYTLTKLHKRTLRLEDIEKKIHTLIDYEFSPNYFIASNSLLHLAINNDNPTLVQYLIDNGADINLYSHEKRPISPFISAMTHSPLSALLLFKQKNLDLQDIKKNFRLARLKPVVAYKKSADALIKILVTLLKDNIIQPDNILSYITPGGRTTSLGAAISLFELSSQKNLQLIEELLKRKANPQEEYFDFFKQNNTTPLQVAQQLQNQELINLLGSYIKKN